MNFKYECFGLVWLIPFKCPELKEITEDAPVDINIYISKIPKRLKKGKKVGPLMRVSENKALYSFMEVGEFGIENGKTIYINPTKGITHSVRLFLFGTISSLLLLQRGLIPLHGSGILYKGKAVLFLGHSGFGKSTTLGGFIQKGYRMITDDISAIDTSFNYPVVSPSFPSMKLWEDSLKMLNKTSENLEYIRGDKVQKFKVPVQEICDNQSKIIVNTIYALNPTDAIKDVEIEIISNSEKVNELINFTFQKMALKHKALHQEHFFKVLKIVNHIRIVRLNRPKNGASLERLVTVVENDLLENE